MSCPYLNRCSDENIKCGRCMLSEKQSHYVEYHEYPADKVTDPPFDDVGDGFPLENTATFICPSIRDDPFTCTDVPFTET